MIAGVAATVQLLHPDQRHMIGTPLGARFGRSQVDTVEATPADIRHCFVAVHLSVPCVSAVLLFAERFPHVDHA